MLNYEMELLENGNWWRTFTWNVPFKDAATLDESLDFGEIILHEYDRAEIIKPFTVVRITIYDDVEGYAFIDNLTDLEKSKYYAGQFYRIVSDSRVEQLTFNNQLQGQFRHFLSTIELTKILEREMCDTLTFTKCLNRDYLNNSERSVATYLVISGKTETKESSFVKNVQYYSPFALNGTMTIASCANSFLWSFPKTAAILESKSNLVIINPLGSQEVYSYNQGASLKMKHEGVYKLQYNVTIKEVSSPYIETLCRFTYPIAIYKNIAEKPMFSITSVLNRILKVGKTRRRGIESQKYTLDPVIAEKYISIEAPEFHITRCTLWEALSQVGNYIHAVPRLEYPNIITFDELGGTNVYTVPEGIPMETFLNRYSVNEYCDSIDSTVENFLNTKDLSQGSIVEPSINGYKSVRCSEAASVISNDTALVLLEYPCYRISKIEVAKNVSGVWELVGEITPYAYEEAEYKTLTSFSGAYPYSKGYALKYKQGDNVITELAFKEEALFGAGTKNPVIQNIIERIGKSCPSAYTELGFRVTYVPMTSARITQRKPYLESGAAEGNNTLIYNQNANTVESSSYGENLKGAITRLGNMDEERTYWFYKYADIPKVGQLLDGLYIAKRETEYSCNGIKVTITLTKDFNRLAEYLGIHTNYRFYDVSEKQSVERHINYGENVIIGDDVPNLDAENAGITKEGIENFKKTFHDHGEINSVNNAVAATLEDDGTKITTVMLSCSSVGVGNSIAFNWKYKDNFGAGYKSGACNLAGGQRVQEFVPYGNVYGEANKLSLRLFSRSPFLSNNNDLPHQLPEIHNGQAMDSEPLFSFDSNPFIIQKDSREQLNITTQLHFISNRKGIVIGSGLGQMNGLVTGAPLEVELKYFKDKYLNVYESFYPCEPLLKNRYGISVLGKKLMIAPNYPPEGVKSWGLFGIRRDKNGAIKYKQLIIGENIADGVIKPIMFNFVSNK